MYVLDADGRVEMANRALVELLDLSREEMVGETETGFFVEDDGSGIPPEEREAVFEHGYTTDDGGTGYGLAIVRSVVVGHGWTIQVAEAPDGGARFEVDVGRIDGGPPNADAGEERGR